MSCSFFTVYLYLILNARRAASTNLVMDLLQEYPSHPNCDLQFVTDQRSKLDSLFSSNGMNFRPVTLWDLSAKKDSFPNKAVSSFELAKCDMVFVDADQMLATDFIEQIHSKGLLGQTHFYAVKLKSVQILHERNMTEIYDFSHLIFLVEKVPHIILSVSLLLPFDQNVV